ncbi:hypothetical protein [Nocardia abscessus]|uniref:hypothetical protein n=1 Tax=Nocardia abscessus TaxID=120957 RepID=UPI002454ACD5|nr:hypothetical protein [Nocardia abscessus]
MITPYAWTMAVTEDGLTFLTAITAVPAKASDPIAYTPGSHLIDPDISERARAALIDGVDRPRADPVRLYRIGGAHSATLHDLAIAVALDAWATAPPWRILLEQIVFVAELGRDGSLRPARPATITAAVAAAARVGLRDVVLAAPDNHRYLHTVEGLTMASWL